MCIVMCTSDKICIYGDSARNSSHQPGRYRFVIVYDIRTTIKQQNKCGDHVQRFSHTHVHAMHASEFYCKHGKRRKRKHKTNTPANTVLEN